MWINEYGGYVLAWVADCANTNIAAVNVLRVNSLAPMCRRCLEFEQLK